MFNLDNPVLRANIEPIRLVVRKIVLSKVDEKVSGSLMNPIFATINNRVSFVRLTYNYYRIASPGNLSFQSLTFRTLPFQMAGE